MRTVLIVDDELPARELLKISFKSVENEFIIIGEARNGEDAYCKYKKLKPDIVITDIQMPLVDGIELIKKIKSHKTNQKIIILSCHESFEYAKLAIKLGVSDYLIKDSYTDTELFSLLKSISDNKTEEKLINNRKSTIDKNFVNMINNNEEAIKIIREDFEEENKNFFVTVCDTEKKEEVVFENIDNIISYRIEPYRLISIHKIDENNSRLLTLNNWYSEITKFKKIIDELNTGIVTIGVSKLFKEFNNIQEYYKQALKARDFVVFYGKGKIIYFDNIQRRNDVKFIDELKENFKLFKNAFDHRNEEKILSLLNDMYRKDIVGMMLYNYLYYVNSLLFGYLTYVITTFNLEFNDICNEDEFTITKVNELETLEDMRLWMEEKFISVLIGIGATEKYSDFIKRAISYINRNYNYDFSIEEVADAVGVHKVYLSRIFKAEVGKTISVYINELRISKAILLFQNKEVKNSDIAYEVGYNSTQNFHHAFKQVMGITPKEYQKSKK